MFCFWLQDGLSEVIVGVKPNVPIRLLSGTLSPTRTLALSFMSRIVTLAFSAANQKGNRSIYTAARSEASHLYDFP